MAALCQQMKEGLQELGSLAWGGGLGVAMQAKAGWDFMRIKEVTCWIWLVNNSTPVLLQRKVSLALGTDN